MNGRFITIEGIEGVGKSTACQIIIQFFHAQNQPALLTREPGGTPIGEAIRQIILHDTPHAMVPMTELLLMFAARAQHIEQMIKPALKQQQWVISDRFTDASFAYQGGGRGIAVDKIALLETLVQNDLRPGLTLLLDAPVEVALARLQSRGKLDRIEQETTDFFERCRTAYLARAKAQPARYRIIDASLDAQAVKAVVQRNLTDYMSQL